MPSRPRSLRARARRAETPAAGRSAPTVRRQGVNPAQPRRRDSRGSRYLGNEKRKGRGAQIWSCSPSVSSSSFSSSGRLMTFFWTTGAPIGFFTTFFGTASYGIPASAPPSGACVNGVRGVGGAGRGGGGGPPPRGPPPLRRGAAPWAPRGGAAGGG